MAMTEEQQRIRSYLTAQAAKLSPADIVDKVRLAMTELSAAAASVPAPRFADRPAQDEWSANEVLAHVVTTGARLADGITTILDGGTVNAPVRDVIESGAPLRSAEDWLKRLDADRSALFQRVLRAEPHAH